MAGVGVRQDLRATVIIPAKAHLRILAMESDVISMLGVNMDNVVAWMDMRATDTMNVGCYPEILVRVSGVTAMRDV